MQAGRPRAVAHSPSHLDFLPIGACVGQAQAEDGPYADVDVRVADVVADERKGGVVLVLDAGVQYPNGEQGACGAQGES